MKIKFQWLCAVLVTVCGHIAFAEQSGGDPLNNLLIPPEVLVHHGAEIGLTAKQVEQIRTRVEEAGPRGQELQTQLNTATGRLAELLSVETFDAEAALEQLDQVLAIENDLKQRHMRLLIQIRNDLTAEQRRAAARVRQTPVRAEDLERRLKAKISRIETAVQSRAEAGEPPFEVIGLMQKLPELMQHGQVREAEALLDRVITMLGLDKKALKFTQKKSTGEKPVKPDNEPASGKKKAHSPTADPKRIGLGRSAAAVLGDFYRPDEVQSIHLRVADEDMQRMLAALPERIYVPASFRWRDISVENVAIRFKGNSSSRPNQPHKRSLLIKFDKYDDDCRFFGLRRVSFDNGVQFGSLFSEPIITDILRDQGIKTHRCNYARIYLNEVYQGVFVNVERIDESFIEHHLPDPNGLLFKVDEGGPGANLQFLGDDPSAYKRTFEAKTESAEKELARLVEFIRSIDQSEQSDFAAMLESKMELDDFLGVTAVMLLSGAFDQLTGWGPHNYYLYHDAKHDRWRYLPWDLDVGFCETAFGQVHVLADWNAAWPVATSGPPNPLLERIIADPMLLQRYRRAARTILDKSFEPEHLCGIIDAKYELIKHDLQTDPFPHRRATVPGDRGYDDIVESLKEFVRRRYASALGQLENPGPRPEVVRRPPGGRAGNRPTGLPPHLAGKIQRIQQHVREMQQNGQDISPIHKVMQRVGPLVQQGNFEEAAAVLDRALEILTNETIRQPDARHKDKPSRSAPGDESDTGNAVNDSRSSIRKNSVRQRVLRKLDFGFSTPNSSRNRFSTISLPP